MRNTAFVLVLLFVSLNFLSFAQNAVNDIITIDKYVNNQSNTIQLTFNYGKQDPINKTVLKQLESKTIYHIDFVYSAYKSSESFDQLNLNTNRIGKIKKLLSPINLDDIKWRTYEQTSATTKTEAELLFHGFVIHYGNNIDYESQNEYFSDLQKPFSMIDIDNQTGGRVAYYTGSSIIMDKLAVTYPNGDTVIGTYQLYYREFRNSAEIALSGIPMTYTENNRDEIFNSAGMYEIIAKKDGVELVLVKPATINFQCTQILPDVGFFELNQTDNWEHSEPINFEDEAADKFSDKGQVYDISLDGDFGSKRVSTSKYKPEEYIDQGSYQGYSHLKQLMTISKDQIFVQLNDAGWRKFKIIYDKPNSTIKSISSQLEEDKQCLLIMRDSATFFIESILDQKLAQLNVEVVGKGTNVYTCSSSVKNGLTNIVGNEPIPPSPGLVRGLSSANFGVYNCDQTKRITAPVALTPTYYDSESGVKIEELYVACVIDLDLNASLSYHPNHLVCNDKGNTKILLFTESKGIYLFDENNFKELDLTKNKVDMQMVNITADITCSDDLKKVLSIGG